MFHPPTGSVYQPTLPENKHFFALSAYVNTLTFLGVMDNDGVFSPNETSNKAMEYCKMVGLFITRQDLSE